AELLATTGEPADQVRLDRARRLFAQVLELPRGLGIMTIHALCGALLRRFPLEAGVAPHFETIDERSAGELMQEALQQVLRAGRDAATPLGRAMQALAVLLPETTLGETLAELLGQRLRLLRCRAAFQNDLEAMLAGIAQALGTEPGLEPASLEERACADGQYDAQGLLAAAQALARGSDKDAERGRGIATWLGAAPADRVRLLGGYKRWFLKADGGGLKTLATKKVASEPVLRALTQEQARLVRLGDQVRGLLLAIRTEALLRVAFAAIDAYEQLKQRAASLDYDDLIERARELLQRPGKTEWVLFKLDARIDHVLVDEAQDTSPQQWEVILKLTDEFFAGAGARTRPRTLFVVGDEKQSIYSFQGADLANFRRVRDLLRSRAEAAQTPVRAELLDRSFRSVPAVLAVIDAVFALPEAREGVVEADAMLAHATERVHAPGLVELWPLARPADHEAAGEPWPLPDAPRPSDEPERRVARAIARTIRQWLDQGEILESTGRPVRAGDILILLGRRGIVQELIIRALKQAGVPVAGADRLALRDHIAVQDLVALGRAMLLPEDDLNLACLLKSPLVGLDEQALFDLAWNRGADSLIERLRAAAEVEPRRFAVAYAKLAGWLQRADFMPPFEFYAWVLGADGGRRRMLARLGPDAVEPIEAFLGQTLAYEQGHPAAMEGFLHWLGLDSGVLKRDAEKVRDMVRLATVHGAKGLEAPIVILADAGPRGRSQRGRLLWSEPVADGTGVELPFWRAARANRDGLTERIAQRENARDLEERRRLLYV
ncbi:MAG: UvrD-helicase domain-containing protein, partial [Geminicoccaceae bacterium]